VAEAFSRKGEQYDAFGQDHPNLIRMRRKVYAHVLGQLHPGDVMLELNAGTGQDALFFAQQGYRVHATDIAPGMLAQIAGKIERYQVQERLTVQPCSFTELDQVVGGPYQYVFSNMGGLNCIADLAQVTRQLPALLTPGARVTWVIMPTICLWDLAAALVGDFKTARRRLSPHGVLAHVEGVHFMTYYFTPQQVIAAFGPAFRLVQLQGLSVFTPTADRKNFARYMPWLFRLLCWLDDKLADDAPFNRWGDFFILTMQYQPDTLNHDRIAL
jgi:SAM-dependent methyltransferase